jgi:hypothetical protein
VSISADWSVTTPHDLDAERISIAFGGYSSCVELVDTGIPAVKTYLRRQLRLEPPLLIRSAGDRWRLRRGVDSCCGRTVHFRSLQAAAEHFRSAAHVAAAQGARLSTVRAVGQAVLAAHGAQEPVRLPEEALSLVGTCVAGIREAALLWASGIPPAAIADIHHQVAADGPLTPWFYLGVVTNRPDLRWVRETAADAPQLELHEWLAWSETEADRKAPRLRSEWVRLGVSRRDMAGLSAAGYRPTDVDELARGLNTCPTGAAATLGRWVTAGCRPAVAEMVEALRAGDSHPSAVNKAGLDRLASGLSAYGLDSTREQLAYAIALCGSPAVAQAVVSAMGSIAPRDVADGLEAWEDARRPVARERERTAHG